MIFEDLKLREPILSAVLKAGYKTPSPIQEQAIPVLLKHHDMIACAQTGTGKTAAFVLPILEQLVDSKNKQIKALVMSPTRELAIQTFENFKKFGRYLKLRAVCVYGGSSMTLQLEKLNMGCDILIATPGRLNDFIEHGKVDVSDVQIFVLDEADRMLDMGFIHDIRNVVKKLPLQKQTIMLSATMPKEIEILAKQLLNQPKEIKIDIKPMAAETIEQRIIFVEKGDKKRILKDLLLSEEVQKSIIFTRTKIGADRLAKRLEEFGITSLVIHGNKTQGQRQHIMQQFRTNQIKVLVATDVVARGLDVIDITHVFNYDLPEEAESYVHRIGRVGRAGKKGFSISLCCKEEMSILAQIEDLLRYEISEMKCQYSILLKRKKSNSKCETTRMKGTALKKRKQKSMHTSNALNQSVVKKSKKEISNKKYKYHQKNKIATRNTAYK